MQNICLRLVVWILIVACFVYADPGSTELWESTRVVQRQQHFRSGSTIYPHRAYAEMILRELDLRDNDGSWISALEMGGGLSVWPNMLERKGLFMPLR
jgi:hypothetical protein